MMRSNPERRFRALADRLAAIGLLMAVVACAGTPARNPVPPELTSKVGIEGIPEARFWGGEWPKFSLERFETRITDGSGRDKFQWDATLYGPILGLVVGF